MNEIDPISSDESPGIPDGPLRLWFTVLVDCFISIRDGWGNQETARQWIEDPENPFFEALADHLGYDPEGLRRRIRKALQRAAKVERQSWQDRIRERMRSEEQEGRQGGGIKSSQILRNP